MLCVSAGKVIDFGGDRRQIDPYRLAPAACSYRSALIGVRVAAVADGNSTRTAGSAFPDCITKYWSAYTLYLLVLRTR